MAHSLNQFFIVKVLINVNVEVTIAVTFVTPTSNTFILEILEVEFNLKGSHTRHQLTDAESNRTLSKSPFLLRGTYDINVVHISISLDYT
jgi:hypothetical protein